MKVLQLLKNLKLRKKALNQGDRRLKERKNKLFFSIFCLFVLHVQCVKKNLIKKCKHYVMVGKNMYFYLLL